MVNANSNCKTVKFPKHPKTILNRLKNGGWENATEIADYITANQANIKNAIEVSENNRAFKANLIDIFQGFKNHEFIVLSMIEEGVFS